MFFKKILPHNEEQPNEIEEEIKSVEISQTDNPIYILGNNPLGHFLASRFIDAGEKVIIISNKVNNNVFCIKEEHSLRKNKYTFNTSFWIKQEPKMLIITCPTHQINSAITALSPTKINHAPIVSFTPVLNKQHIEAYLKAPLMSAFLDGALAHKEKQTTILGRAPSIELVNNNEYDSEAVCKYFEKAAFKTQISHNEKQSFWQFFSTYGLGSIITAAFDQTMFNFSKDKERRDFLKLFAQEMSNLCTSEGVKINPDDILKKLNNIPVNYLFPLHQDIKSGHTGELDYISSMIINTSRQNNVSINKIHEVIKKLYNIILV